MAGAITGRMNLDAEEPVTELLELIPINFARHNELVPLKLTADGCLVAIADPLNTSALDDVKMLLKAGLVCPWNSVKEFPYILTARGQEVVGRLLEQADLR